VAVDPGGAATWGELAIPTSEVATVSSTYPARVRPARSVGVTSLFALLVSFVALTTTPAQAVSSCDISWTGEEDADWHDDGNWTLDRVPGDGDTVCIDADENLPAVFSEGATTIASLQNNHHGDLGQRLHVAGGELSVTGNSLLEGDYTLRVAGGTLSTAGTLTIEGPFLLGSSGTLAGSGTTRAKGSVQIAGGGITIDGHTLELDGDTEMFSAFVTLENGAVLHNLDELNIRGSVVGGDGEVVNEHDAALRDTGSATNSRLDVPFINRGYVRIVSRTLELTAGGVHEGVYGGTFESNYVDVISSGILDINGPGTTFTVAEGAQVYVFGNGTVNVRAGELVVESEGFDSAFPAGENGDIVSLANGLLVFDADTEVGNLRIAGGLDGSGDVVVAGGGFFSDNTTWSDGTIDGAPGTELRYLIDLELTGMAGDRVLGAGRDLIVEGDLVDETPATSTSTLTIGSGASLHVTGSFLNERVDVFVDGSFSAGTHELGANVRLGGSGTIVGDVTTAGTVAPGTSPGVLGIDGDYVQLAGSELEIELAGTTLGQFDRLEVGGGADLDGTLTVELIDGFTPAIGDVFEILVATEVSGTFSTEDLPSLDGEATMFVVYDADRVVLAVTDGSEPDLDQPTEPPADPIDDEVEDMDNGTDDASEETTEEVAEQEEAVEQIEPDGDEAGPETLPATGGILRGPLVLALALLLAGSLLVRHRRIDPC
jgi:hypothetical protein